MSKPTIENRKARYNYFIEDTIECGISLRGNEVKSIYEGMCNIKDSWVQIQNGNLVIRGMHITPWRTSNSYDIDIDREIQLLAHKKEIIKLENKLKTDGYNLIPLKIYFNDKGKCKMFVGICKGKHTYDKRNALKEKQIKRDIERSYK